MATLNFQKTPSNKNVTVWVGPTGTATGVTDVGEPLADELNNTGGASGMVYASEGISWNDWSFGMQASDTNSEPSMADAAQFTERGKANFGGSFSPYYPSAYTDTGDTGVKLFTLLKDEHPDVDVSVRIDGETDRNDPAADGDLVSTYRVTGDGQTNPFTPGESKRYTKNFFQSGDFGHLVPVGDQAITAIPKATDPYKAGTSGRLRASIQGRDVTGMVIFTSDDSDVIEINRGGSYTINGSASDTATVTISHPYTADTASVSVTVTA